MIAIHFFLYIENLVGIMFNEKCHTTNINPTRNPLVSVSFLQRKREKERERERVAMVTTNHSNHFKYDFFSTLQHGFHLALTSTNFFC